MLSAEDFCDQQPNGGALKSKPGRQGGGGGSMPASYPRAGLQLSLLM